MNFIAYVLTKLRIPEDVVYQMPKESRLRRPYHQQHGKWSQTLLKYASIFTIFIDHWESIWVEKSLS